ncbi:methyltransferase-like protein 23 isoform X2 [Anoplopoma fimbria]|uniref:methyltransferase-like protein 23 isoform X2 n=1 Tax=Anoplopoma fimbria TaxID=229290 RepID=UPI0023EAECFC|nr:methyltransferase-like protein 23 isoform X2 [Anoplopoma fimbria]
MEHSGEETPSREFTFRDNNSEDCLCVSIPEVLDPQYGMYVWPSAVVLAQYLWKRREELRFSTVLENCRRSCEANGLRDVAVVTLTWGEVSPELLLLPELHIILGSDVFYEPQDFEDVLLTVAFLLRKNPRAQFWTTYQERSADWSIEALLHRWNLNCVDVQLETFDADEAELAGSTLPGNHSVLLMIITLRTEDEVM